MKKWLMLAMFLAVPVLAQGPSQPSVVPVPSPPTVCGALPLYIIAPGNSGAGTLYGNSGTGTSCAILASPGGGGSGTVGNGTTGQYAYYSANGTAVAGAASPVPVNTIYASQGNASVAGCTLNSNLSTGGGTVASACMQAQLDWLGSNGGGEWILNGPALLDATKQNTTNSVDGNTQTTCLQTHSNVTIRALPGSGVFLKANSNCIALGNNISGNTTSSTYQTNMKVLGGTWNLNNANQSLYEQGNSSYTNGWNYGFWFGGFSNLEISDVTILNSPAFAYFLTNGAGCELDRDTATFTTTVPSVTTYQDGIHWDGPMSDCYVNNFTDNNGDDDPIALNTNEGVAIYVAQTAWLYQRYPNSGGAINNVFLNGVYLNDPLTPGRFIGYTGVAGSVATVSNIRFKDVFGTTQQGATATVNVTSAGPVTIDNWQVPKQLSLPSPPFTNVITYAGPAIAPVASWPLNTGGSFTLNDTSGGGNTMTATNATWTTVAGLPGSALTFNGSSTVASGANSTGEFDFSNPFTVSAWVSWASLTGEQMIADDFSTATDNPGWGLLASVSGGNKVLELAFNNATGSSINVSNASLTLNTGTLYHVCAQYTGSSTGAGMTLYLNGALIATGTGTITGSMASSTVVHIGSSALSSSLYLLDGSEGDVRLYGASSPTCAQLYAAGPQ